MFITQDIKDNVDFHEDKYDNDNKIKVNRQKVMNKNHIDAHNIKFGRSDAESSNIITSLLFKEERQREKLENSNLW